MKTKVIHDREVDILRIITDCKGVTSSSLDDNVDVVVDLGKL